MHNEIKSKNFWSLIFGTAFIGITSSLVSIGLLYQTAYIENSKEFKQTATMVAGLMQAVAEFDIENSANTNPLGAWGGND